MGSGFHKKHYGGLMTSNEVIKFSVCHGSRQTTTISTYTSHLGIGGAWIGPSPQPSGGPTLFPESSVEPHGKNASISTAI